MYEFTVLFTLYCRSCLQTGHYHFTYDFSFCCVLVIDCQPSTAINSTDTQALVNCVALRPTSALIELSQWSLWRAV